ncbi:hypothetical protein KDL29_13610 [bacterium]|nr:hypothetical protein [bacterium]
MSSNDDAQVGRILSRREALLLLGGLGLLVASGCGSSAAVSGSSLLPTEQFPGLPGLPSGSSDSVGRVVSLLSDNLLTGSQASEHGGNSMLADTALSLGPGAVSTDFSWGIWGWGGLDSLILPSQLLLELAIQTGMQYTLLISNYSSGRWEVHANRGSQALSHQYQNTADYVSPNGNTYVALIVSGTNSMLANSLNLLAVALPSVVATPDLTEGPFFEDEDINDPDMLSGTSRSTVVNGIPLALNLLVYEINGSAITPLEGAKVDIWHCDAIGVYSDEPAGINGEDTQGQTWLRRYQLTDGNGAAGFNTIYPGWYTSRATHIHFKVRKYNGQTTVYEFTSQLFFDDSLSSSIFSSAPYVSGNRVLNSQDNIYQETDEDAGDGSKSGPKLLLDVQPSGKGYAATFVIGLKMS